MGHPFEGWSAINEGWDTGGADVNELLANLKTTARNFLGPVAIALALMWGAKALFTLGVGALMVVAQLGEMEVLFTVASVLGWVGYLIITVISLLQMSLYRPLQVQAFAGPEEVGGIRDVFQLSKDVIGKVALTTMLYGLMNLIGMLGCLVGALIPFFFFFQAPYLAATTELSPWECMRRSYELTKAYFMPVLAALVASLGIGAVLNGCGGVIVGAVGTMLMTVNIGLGSTVITLGTDLFGLLGACGMLVISGGLFTSIQSIERSVPFKR